MKLTGEMEKKKIGKNPLTAIWHPLPPQKIETGKKLFKIGLANFFCKIIHEKKFLQVLNFELY